VFRTVSVPLAQLRAAGHAHGVTLNDAFMAAVALGAGAYHRDSGEQCERFAAGFVVSTRHDDVVGGNAFTPTRVLVPGGDLPAAEVVAAVAAATAVAKQAVDGDGLLASLAGMANLLPTVVMTRLARNQAARVDFLTSNVKASPVPTWVGGALVEENYALGPVAGTAFNATLMSYCGRVDVGLHIDPVAVTDPDRLADAVGAGFARLGCDVL
jgi:hypothetical protein